MERKRRQYDAEFSAGAVRIVAETGKPPVEFERVISNARAERHQEAQAA